MIMKIESFQAVLQFRHCGPKAAKTKTIRWVGERDVPLVSVQSLYDRAEIIVTHATDTLCTYETHTVTGREVYCPRVTFDTRLRNVAQKSPGFGLLCPALEAYGCIRACVMTSRLEIEQIQNSGVIGAAHVEYMLTARKVVWGGPYPACFNGCIDRVRRLLGSGRCVAKLSPSC
jgi:hypothetical protein